MSFFATMGQVVIVFTLVVLAYGVLAQKRKGNVQGDIPRIRYKPIIVTKDGLKVPEKTITLSPTKFQMVYDDGYSPIYHIDDNHCDLIEIDKKQNIFGSQRPIYIEYDMLLNLAYNYEHVPTRKLLKKMLAEMKKAVRTKTKIGEKSLKKMFADFEGIAQELLEKPDIYKNLKQDYDDQKNSKAKYQGQVQKLETATEGRVQRRVKPIIDVAGKRASATIEERTRTQQ